MADPIPVVKVADRLTSLETYKKWAIYVGITCLALLLIIGMVSLWKFFFPTPDKQINKPTAVILPGATVKKLDQSNTQVLVDEKPWEVGLGVAGIRYDNKDGALVGGWIKRKW